MAMRRLGLAGYTTRAAVSGDLRQVADLFLDSGHSAFTHFLLRGLRGEALPSGKDFVTANELGSYLQRSVIDATEGKQNPTATSDGLGTFVFRLRDPGEHGAKR